MYLIVGLGNPLKKYSNTYHNLGFLCMDKLASVLGVEFSKSECRAVTAHARIGGDKVILAKPVTYMNLSGESVIELINKYKIEKDKFLVIYDDIDLPLGAIRIRFTGSAGTHNGMRSIVALVNTVDFARIRIGIGRPNEPSAPPDPRPLSDYVLGEISAPDMTALTPAIHAAACASKDFASGISITDVMQKYNKKN